MIWKVGVGILCLAMFSTELLAEGMTFGIAGKSTSDVNFIAAWQGCAAEARKNGDLCIHIGEGGPANFRVQDRAIREAIENGLEGLAVSVTNSTWLHGHSLQLAASKNIPVITFDSDLDRQHAHLRSAFVGPDNQEFGRELGRLARELNPQGGTVWLMSGGPYNTNLNQRLTGVRQVLIESERLPNEVHTEKANGWKEHLRSPWYNGDDYKRALKQMKVALSASEVDVFISVGAWPLIDPDRYRTALDPEVKEALEQNKRLVIIGTGALQPGQWKLLRDKLVHAYVTLDFTEMGRIAYRNLKALAGGEAVPPATYTKSKTYLLRMIE